ncbi:hypothetical protein [Ruminobacter amylophilus]|uniref:hypothetical protein n=1 Tax=Ruminobacter amylophilus TaxID=867 RepID=UPI0038694D85
MSFKKTVTFTANVSDYTDGTVSARVQAENKILGDLVTFILSHNLGISIQEKVEIGSSKWAGDPFYCSTSGATTDVNNNRMAGDFYFLGRGIAKKCLGLSVDNHNLYIALTDTPTHDLTFSGSMGNFARVPCAQMRNLKNSTFDTNRFSSISNVSFFQFPTNADALSLTITYWKKGNILVIRSNGRNVVISKDPYTVLLSGTEHYRATHFSLDDDFLISLATYSFSANNGSYSSNVALGYAMSYSPFFVKIASQSIWYNIANENFAPTSILCHLIGSSRTIYSHITDWVDTDSNGLAANGNMPTVGPLMFPRIANNELYIKKFYVPMTYPAVASPIKIGYTPGKLNAENVYSLNGKNYVCLNNGVIGLFVEVEDQGD